jgi:hypothetical protein
VWGCSGPRIASVGVGCSWVETLASSPLMRPGRRVLPDRLLFGVGVGCGKGLVWVVLVGCGILLGPEGTSHAGGVGFLLVVADHAGVTYGFLGESARCVVGVGLRVV